MGEQKPVNLRQLGTTGLRRTKNYVYEEFLPQLRWPEAGRIYQEMADNDAVIGSILYLAEMLIRGTDWDVVPASTAQADIEAANFLKSCMHDMDMSWNNTICEILSMLTYGFSLHEIVYKVRRGPEEASSRYRSKYSDGRIGWRRLPIRAQNSICEWEFNDEGDVIAAIQQAEPLFKRIRIPMSKALLFRTRVSKDNPEGRSMLRNAYRSYYFKHHLEEIEGIGIERDLAGFPVLTAPENLDLWNADDPQMVALKASAEALVTSIRRDSEEGVLLPHGWELTLLTSGSSRQIDIGQTIERYDNRIAITLLSDIVLIGSGRQGSYALADTKQSLLASALQAQLSNIADVFNAKAVPDLFSYNSFEGLTGLPKIVPGMLATPKLSEVALMLRAMGLNISKDMELQNYLRHILCMPQLDEATFNEAYRDQTQGTQQSVDSLDDTNEKLFEQNDLVHV